MDHLHVLEGLLVRLELLRPAHFRGLLHSASGTGLWEYSLYGDLSEPSRMREFIGRALELHQAGSDLPFAIIHQQTGRVVGSTRLRDINTSNLNLEIGGTWIARDFHQSGVNLECKYLLLRHAFEHIGVLRTQFKTDARNMRSRVSLEKLGAVNEGLLRRHTIMPDGTVRDTVIYSILDIEWGRVKESLETRLGRHGQEHFSLPHPNNRETCPLR